MNSAILMKRHDLLPLLFILSLTAFGCDESPQHDADKPAVDDTTSTVENNDTSLPPGRSSDTADVPSAGTSDISPELISFTKQSNDASMAGLSGVNKENGVGQRYRRGMSSSIPDFIPNSLDGLDLVLLDESSDGWLAMYEGGTKELSDVPAYRVVLYDRNGARLWLLNLNQFFTGTTHLEVQDIRYHEAALYFNAACNTYSSDADGQCSWLFRVDPMTQRIDWRTAPLISNNIFIPYKEWIIAGYGFTNEPDSLYMIDSDSGKIVWRHELASAHSYLEVTDDVLHVVTYDGYYRFRMR